MPQDIYKISEISIFCIILSGTNITNVSEVCLGHGNYLDYNEVINWLIWGSIFAKKPIRKQLSKTTFIRRKIVNKAREKGFNVAKICRKRYLGPCSKFVLYVKFCKKIVVSFLQISAACLQI